MKGTSQTVISRSKLDRFLSCPYCFYLETRLGLRRPSGPPFLLNSLVDAQMKSWMDQIRSKDAQFPYVVPGIDGLKLYLDPRMRDWRNPFKGIRHFDQQSGLTVQGAIDEILIDASGTLYIADFKATSSAKEIDLNDGFKRVFRRQVSIYAWLLAQNGFSVSHKGLLVFLNAIKSANPDSPDIQFAVEVKSFDTETDWISETLMEIRKLLNSSKPPTPDPTCKNCVFENKLFSVRCKGQLVLSKRDIA